MAWPHDNLKNKILKKGDPRTIEIARMGGQKSRKMEVKLRKILDNGELDNLIKMAIDLGNKGDLRAIEFIFNRAYGKPKENVSIDMIHEEKPSELLQHLSDDKLDQLENWLNEAKLKLTTTEVEAEVVDDDEPT